MIIKMLILLLCWVVGYAISVLISWVKSPKTFSFNLPQLVLSVILGVVAGFFAAKIQLDGWLIWAVFIVAGFISETIIKFLADKASQINGEG